MKRFTGKGKTKVIKSNGFSNKMQAALYNISRRKKGAPLATGYFNPQDSSNGVDYYYDTSVFFFGATITDYSLNGTLPTGLVLDSITGIISGTPSVINTFSGISIIGTNNSGSDTTNEADITIS